MRDENMNQRRRGGRRVCRYADDDGVPSSRRYGRTERHAGVPRTEESKTTERSRARASRRSGRDSIPDEIALPEQREYTVTVTALRVPRTRTLR